MSAALRRSTLLLAASALFVHTAMAQPARAKVMLYKDRIAAQWDTVECVKNVVSINPLLFLRGEIPVYYERALSVRLSAILGVGLTYRNYLNFDLAGDDVDDFSAGTQILAKPSFHLGGRYYLQDDLEPQGTYLQVEFAYLNYSKNITEKDSTGRFTDRKRLDERIYNDVRLLFGYQRLSGNNNWVFDFYGGVALRARDMTIVHEDLEPVARQWVYRTEEKRDNVPAFFLGVKVGLGF
ncbi:MAG: hypothetical protein QM724_02440 [Flavobacteriales bacterium]